MEPHKEEEEEDEEEEEEEEEGEEMESGTLNLVESRPWIYLQILCNILFVYVNSHKYGDSANLWAYIWHDIHNLYLHYMSQN